MDTREAFEAAKGHLDWLKRVNDDPQYVARAVGYEECLSDWQAALTQPQPTGAVVDIIEALVLAGSESYRRGLADNLKSAIAAMQQPTAPAGALTEAEAVEMLTKELRSLDPKLYARAAYRALSALPGNSVKGVES